MNRARWPEWAPFVVDGETYYWTSYPSKRRWGAGPWASEHDGPWEPIESLDVSRAPNVAGIGTSLPPGSDVTEQHAIDLVRLFKSHGREVP